MLQEPTTDVALDIHKQRTVHRAIPRKQETQTTEVEAVNLDLSRFANTTIPQKVLLFILTIAILSKHINPNQLTTCGRHNAPSTSSITHHDSTTVVNLNSSLQPTISSGGWLLLHQMTGHRHISDVVSRPNDFSHPQHLMCGVRARFGIIS